MVDVDGPTPSMWQTDPGCVRPAWRVARSMWTNTLVSARLAQWDGTRRSWWPGPDRAWRRPGRRPRLVRPRCAGGLVAGVGEGARRASISAPTSGRWRRCRCQAPSRSVQVRQDRLRRMASRRAAGSGWALALVWAHLAFRSRTPHRPAACRRPGSAVGSTATASATTVAWTSDSCPPARARSMWCWVASRWEVASTSRAAPTEVPVVVARNSAVSLAAARAAPASSSLRARRSLAPAASLRMASRRANSGATSGRGTASGSSAAHWVRAGGARWWSGAPAPCPASYTCSIRHQPISMISVRAERLRALSRIDVAGACGRMAA